MFYFQTNYLHFSPEFLGRVQLVGSIASLGGVALYKTLLKVRLDDFAQFSPKLPKPLKYSPYHSSVSP